MTEKAKPGSTAQMAKWLGLPVILVVDAKSMARSAAALVQGFEQFDKELTFAGVLFNNVGSEGHLRYLKDALEDNVNMPCLGGIVHEKEIAIPERHLGLVTRNDHVLSDETMNALADIIDKATDADALLDILPEISVLDDLPSPHVPSKTPFVRIGVAMDNAFCFYYQDNFDILEACGAELVYFSPMKDNDLPENLDGLYLGGGYPELFAKQLADNVNLRNQIREKSSDGMPIYGECGGFMYLCREISDTEGNTYPMTNCFPFTTRMFPRLKALGYREITLAKDTTIGKRGQTVRGHEFHYSEMAEFSQKIETVYSVSARAGIKKNDEGCQVANTLGSYIHLHFGSRPDAASYFTEACLKYKSSRP